MGGGEAESQPLIETTSVLPESSNSVKYSRSLILACVCASFTGASGGFDVGVFADAIVLVRSSWGLSYVQEEIAIGIFGFVAAFGTLIALQTSDAFGRKNTIILCCLLLALGSLIQALAGNYGVFLAGRVIAGLGIGVSFVVAPIYNTEISPAAARGAMGSLYEISIDFGIAMGYLSGYLCTVYFASDLAWRVMMGLGVVLPVAVMCGLSSLPESPRWLVSQGRHEEALESLQRMGDEAASITIKDIEREDLKIKLVQKSKTVCQDEATTRVMIIAALIGMAQTANGSDAILYYSATILNQAGMKSDVKQMAGSLAIGVSKLAPKLLMFRYYDKIGRRIPMLASAVGVSVATLLFTVAFAIDGSPELMLVSLCLYMFSFGFAIGPLTWVTASEMLPTNARTRGMVMAAFLNRLTSGVITSTTLSLTNALGFSGFFGGSFCITVFIFFFYFFYLEDHSRRSLEDVSADLRSKN